MLTEYEKVTSLLTYLQAMRGRRLWHYEDVSLTQVCPRVPSRVWHCTDVQELGTGCEPFRQPLALTLLGEVSRGQALACSV